MERIKIVLDKVKEGTAFFVKAVGLLLALLVPSGVVAFLALCVTYQGAYGVLGTLQLKPEAKELVAGIPAGILFTIALFAMMAAMSELLCRQVRKNNYSSCSCGR